MIGVLSIQPFDLSFSPLIQDQIYLLLSENQIKFAMILFYFISFYGEVNKSRDVVCVCVYVLYVRTFRIWSAITSNTCDAHMTHANGNHISMCTILKWKAKNINSNFECMYEVFRSLFLRLLVACLYTGVRIKWDKWETLAFDSTYVKERMQTSIHTCTS